MILPALRFPILRDIWVIIGDAPFVGGIVVSVCEMEKLNELDAQRFVAVSTPGGNRMYSVLQRHAQIGVGEPVFFRFTISCGSKFLTAFLQTYSCDILSPFVMRVANSTKDDPETERAFQSPRLAPLVLLQQIFQ